MIHSLFSLLLTNCDYPIHVMIVHLMKRRAILHPIPHNVYCHQQTKIVLRRIIQEKGIYLHLMQMNYIIVKKEMKHCLPLHRHHHLSHHNRCILHHYQLMYHHSHNSYWMILRWRILFWRHWWNLIYPTTK